MAWLEEMLDLIFPPRPVCPLCGEASAGAQVCTGCRQQLAGFREGPRCHCCGRFPAAAAADPGRVLKKQGGKLLCPECLRGEHYFTLARSAGPYEGPLRDAIHRFKFGRKRSLAGALGGLLAGVVEELLLLQSHARHHGPPRVSSPVAGLVPVPLARPRLEERGFNQAALLAQEAAALTGLPVLPVLQKIRETPPQTELSRAERRINLAGAFAVCPAPKSPFPFPAGRAVILIDDVLTTGFTADECARVLRSAGAGEVYLATLAAAG